MQTQTQVISDNLAAVAKAAEEAKAKRHAIAIRLADSGEADGKQIKAFAESHQSAMTTFARDILKARAGELKGNESEIRDYLSGFRKAWSNTGTSKQRASEAGAFLRAYSVKPEVIDAFVGGYHELVTECRKINNPEGNTKTRTSSGNRAPSDKGMDKIVGSIKAMKPEQAQRAVTIALNQVMASNPKERELVIIRQMDSLCAELAKSEQPIFQDLAKNVQEFCSEVLDSVAIDSTLHQEAHNNKAGETIAPANPELKTPQPAAFEPVGEEKQEEEAA